MTQCNDKPNKCPMCADLLCQIIELQGSSADQIVKITQLKAVNKAQSRELLKLRGELELHVETVTRLLEEGGLDSAIPVLMDEIDAEKKSLREALESKIGESFTHEIGQQPIPHFLVKQAD